MKKIFILALGAIAMVSCGNSYKAQDVKLLNTNDSINYALGLLNGDQLHSRDLSDATEKEVKTAVKEFTDALQRGWDGKVEQLGQVASIGQNIGSAVKSWEKEGLAGNNAWTLNEKIFFQGLVNGINNDSIVMTAEVARNFFQSQYMASRSDSLGHDKAITAKCPKKAKVIKLNTVADSLNYAFGMLNGNEISMYVLANDTTGNADVEFINAINKALKDSHAYPQLVQMGENIGKTIKEQSAEGLVGVAELTTDFELIKQGFINGLSQYGDWDVMLASSYIETTIDEIRYGKVKQEGEAFLEANKLREGVITTESGLQYEVLKEGRGPKPQATDRVKVHYHGTLLDGTVFDSSVDRGEPIVFGLNQVIAGWTEGVQLMNVGAKYKFYIPQELAYGSRAAGSIPPYSALIFEVELIGIEK